jgi:hypothetical protein
MGHPFEMMKLDDPPLVLGKLFQYLHQLAPAVGIRNLGSHVLPSHRVGGGLGGLLAETADMLLKDALQNAMDPGTRNRKLSGIELVLPLESPCECFLNGLGGDFLSESSRPVG